MTPIIEPPLADGLAVTEEDGEDQLRLLPAPGSKINYVVLVDEALRIARLLKRPIWIPLPDTPELGAIIRWSMLEADAHQEYMNAQNDCDKKDAS